jgi:hypothetical protein
MALLLVIPVVSILIGHHSVHFKVSGFQGWNRF